MTKRYTLLSLVFMLIMSVAAQIPVRVEELTPDDTPLGYNEDTLRSWILNRLHGGGGLIDTPPALNLLGILRLWVVFGTVQIWG